MDSAAIFVDGFGKSSVLLSLKTGTLLLAPQKVLGGDCRSALETIMPLAQ